MAKFINPFTDVGFKRVFGQEISKPLILDFLNNLLLGEEHVANLTFLDKEQPALYDDDRSLVYDIYCETDTGKKIIVEMQNKSQPYFKSRSIYYVSEAIARQGERGSMWNYAIDAVYLVAFLNFCPMDFERKFRTDVVLADREGMAVFSDKIRMTFMQLPLFDKEAEECDNQFERWIYVLKNMETLTRLPWAAKSAVFQRLEQIADVASLTRQERMKYDEGLRKYRDTLSVLEGAREDGWAEGRAAGHAEGHAEGRAEGIKEEKLETAKRLLSAGVDVSTIVLATGLTVDEVKRLSPGE
ncbi:MAG: Rpn family recombination-promoting nuclease/putative transposase [Bacteroidaceae bacterium]